MPVRIWGSVSIVGLAVFILMSALALLSACAPRTVAPHDPFARQRAAMKPDFANHLDLVELAPRYEIDLTYDPVERIVRGTANVALFNTTADPWRTLVFRLYPAMRHYGGSISIQGVAVNGQPAPFVYESGATVVRINLARPLEKGQRADVRLAWLTHVPQWADSSAVYALFGKSQQMTSLPLFYPSLAVYQPGPTLGAGRWWTETGTVRGDVAFNYASLFVVTATLPADQIPVASGTLLTSTLMEEGLARHVWATGPVREFFLQMSPLFRSTYTETYGTRVTTYWLPGDEAAGRESLTYAVAALRIYSDRFGPYPYRDLRIAPAPLAYRGMEYPQVLLLGTELYGRYRENLEVLIAHEVAHQWWYLIVHNDPVNEPWLDEALAEYSMKIYMEELRGQRNADQLVFTRWQIPWKGLRDRGADTLVNQRVDSFTDGLQYETVVYGKGALFYEALREELGERDFFRFLDRYLERHRYGIVDTAIWQAELAGLQNPAVDALYAEWISQPAASTMGRGDLQSAGSGD